MDEKEKFNGMHLMMIESMRKERERGSCNEWEEWFTDKCGIITTIH
jgi:hypothetical protein